MQEQLRRVMGQIFKVPPSQIIEETKVETIESWDSLNHINLILALEQEFKITFVPEEIVEMISYQEILKVLKHKLQPSEIK